MLYFFALSELSSREEIMDSMQQMLPDEIKTVSREVAREEGIKLFKEFSENLQNLRKAEE